MNVSNLDLCLVFWKENSELTLGKLPVGHVGGVRGDRVRGPAVRARKLRGQVRLLPCFQGKNLRVDCREIARGARGWGVRRPRGPAERLPGQVQKMHDYEGQVYVSI